MGAPIPATGLTRVIVTFVGDANVFGSGNVYTLHATVGGTVSSGDAISLAFHRTGTGATGYLVADPSGETLDTSPWSSPLTGAVIEAGFIWSDLSEVPHFADSGTAGGSRDWTDGLYVEDLAQTQTLIR
jgi:hypothetical protein